MGVITAVVSKNYGCHRLGCDTRYQVFRRSWLEVLLPHSRKAARGVASRGVVAVVGASLPACTYSR